MVFHSFRKALGESAPFPMQRCPQPDAAGPRLSLNSQGRRPAKANLFEEAADLLGSSGLKRAQWRGHRYPAASFLSKHGVLPGGGQAPQGPRVPQTGAAAACPIQHRNCTPLPFLATDALRPSVRAKPLSHPSQHRFPVLCCQIPRPAWEAHGTQLFLYVFAIWPLLAAEAPSARVT